MPACAQCGQTILWGGRREGALRFCGDKCYQRGNAGVVAAMKAVPDEVLDEHLLDLHQGACPRCGGSGPVDIHISHTAYSFAVMTLSNSRPAICCRRCGVKRQVFASIATGVLGWWGFPFGLIFTPVQIGRNIYGMVKPPDPSLPSKELEFHVRATLAAALASKQAARADDDAAADAT